MYIRQMGRKCETDNLQNEKKKLVLKHLERCSKCFEASFVIWDTYWNYDEIYFLPIKLQRIQNLNNTIIAETVRKGTFIHYCWEGKMIQHCEGNWVISNKITNAIDPEAIPPTM